MPKLLYFFLKYFPFASGVMFLQGPMLSFHDVDFTLPGGPWLSVLYLKRLQESWVETCT